MAEGEKVGSKLGKWADIADHPIVFAFALTLLIVPMMALMKVLFAYLGMPGPQALVK